MDPDVIANMIGAWRLQNPDADQFYLAGPKVFPDGRAAWVVPTIFGARIVISPDLFSLTIVDFWCYNDFGTLLLSRAKAMAALSAWDGTGDPDGWTRHFASGRRRPADGTLEIV
jgi:hypothetical protein